MCRLWTNFAKYGDPTPDHDTSLDFKWCSDKRRENLNYLLIQETPKMIDNTQFKRIKFWKSVYDQFNGGFEDPKVLL